MGGLVLEGSSSMQVPVEEGDEEGATSAAGGFLRALPFVAALHPVEGNRALSVCKEAWLEKNVWFPVLEQMHCFNDKDNKLDEASRLTIACSRGNEAYKYAAKLLALNSDVNATSKLNYTAISYASQNGHEAVVRLLLDTNRVDLEVKNGIGASVLLVAAHFGYVNIIDMLLDARADIDAQNKREQTALWCACYYAQVDVANKLLARGARFDLGQSILVAACSEISTCDNWGSVASISNDQIWLRKQAIVSQLLCFLCGDDNDTQRIKEEPTLGAAEALLEAKKNKRWHIVAMLEEALGLS